jgi:hypothetical protein
MVISILLKNLQILGTIFMLPGVLILLIIAPLTLGWKFDKVFDKKYVTCIDPGVPYLSMLTRSMIYMIAIVSFDTKNCCPKKRMSIGPECQKYDFRKHASRFDMIISFIYFYSIAGSFLFGIPWYCLKLYLQYLT